MVIIADFWSHLRSWMILMLMKPSPSTRMSFQALLGFSKCYEKARDLQWESKMAPGEGAENACDWFAVHQRWIHVPGRSTSCIRISEKHRQRVTPYCTEGHQAKGPNSYWTLESNEFDTWNCMTQDAWTKPLRFQQYNIWEKCTFTLPKTYLSENLLRHELLMPLGLCTFTANQIIHTLL